MLCGAQGSGKSYACEMVLSADGPEISGPRFLKPSIAAETKTSEEARAALAPQGKMLACRLVGAWPLGQELSGPVTFVVPLPPSTPSSAAVCAFTKADDDGLTPWVAVPAERVAVADGRAREVEHLGADRGLGGEKGGREARGMGRDAILREL